MNDANHDFLREVKKQLDDSVKNLDGATSTRLNQVRQQALAQQGKATAWWKTKLWLGTALPAAALGLLLYVGIGNQPGDMAQFDQQPPTISAQTSLPADLDLDDLELLLASDDMAMLADLDLLASTNEVGG